MIRKLFSLLATTVLISGCTLIPKYTRPEAPIPDAWPSGTAYKENFSTSEGKLPEDIKWQVFFIDERLKEVIGMALKNNRDLRVAGLNIEKARALYRIQRAELFPTIDAVGSVYKERIPANITGTGHTMTVEEDGLNLGISSWELDFFGRIRSLKKKALEEYLATEQARRSAQISLVTEVAGAYLTLAADRESLKLTEATLDVQQASYDLVRLRYEVGLVSELDLRQAQTRVDAAKVDKALFIRLAAQDENALNLLVGSSVPAELLPGDLETVQSTKYFSSGISSEVLLKRPDILQAENLLKAANANIGAARAALFPRISLTAAAGTASNDLSGLFKAGSGAWSYAPQIIMPIFDSRLWWAVKAVKADREIVLTQYEKAIQTAFREVADSLAVSGTVDEQLLAQQSLVDASAETYRLATARYLKGIDSYLSVLDAQRSLYVAQLRLIVIRLTKISNQVKLYAVLGGGSE
ncbi:MAG: efflux transporter outer membrane subunit [Thermodesulfobacteriota bacterium]|jgi:multidrug efflux system outer membrane protein|nr:MAG: efflux transporter outer membrane subunit [Thermodesulfobacteriota bacterium]